MAKHLVTGGAGFIGSHLVDALLLQGHDVTVLDNFSNGSWDNLKDAVSKYPDRLKVIEGDICDLETCRLACEGIDYVLHKAALGSIPRSIEHPIQTHNSNTNGTLNILIAARDAKVKRFVYASSSSIYGSSKIIPRVESDSPKPISPYAVSKLAGEHYTLSFHHTYGLETVVLRYFNVFGPRQNVLSRYAAVVPRFIQSLVLNQSPVIFGNGEQFRDFTYVENVVAANLLAIKAPREACGRIYNIACAERHTVNEVFNTLRSLLKINIDPIKKEERVGDVRESIADIAEANRWLDYRPVISFNEGLKKTVDSFLINQKAITPSWN
jgi:nucleoside-diphosphate-sugar epimerase